MAKDTRRDRVWRAVLEIHDDLPEYTFTSPRSGYVSGFTKADIEQQLEDVGKRTINDAIQTMLEYSVIEMVKYPPTASLQQHPITGECVQANVYRLVDEWDPGREPQTREENTGTVDNNTHESDSTDAHDEYICNVCGDTFDNERALTTHATHSNNHPRVSQMNSCPECSERIVRVDRIDDLARQDNEVALLVTHSDKIIREHDITEMKTQQRTNFCIVRDGYEV
jgi:DNA-directed RNA polymerase subunit RPC12/RpoP